MGAAPVGLQHMGAAPVGRLQHMGAAPVGLQRMSAAPVSLQHMGAAPVGLHHMAMCCSTAHGSTMTNSHGVAAFDFATVSGCDQLVVGPTHARSGILDLLMTDVPNLIQVVVVADHSYLRSLVALGGHFDGTSCS